MTLVYKNINEKKRRRRRRNFLSHLRYTINNIYEEKSLIVQAHTYYGSRLEFVTLRFSLPTITTHTTQPRRFADSI